MESVEQQKSVIELLKQIADLEFNNRKVEAIIFAKRGSRLVSNKVSEMQECIEENAKEYGKKLEYVQETSKLKSAIEANILRNYTLSLERVNKEFDNKYKTIEEQILKVEDKDIELLIKQDYFAMRRNEEKAKPEYAEEQKLKQEAIETIEDGDYKKLEQINTRLKEISKINNATIFEKMSKDIRADRAKLKETIELCKKELKNCELERKQAIELIAGKKENLLQTADKKYLLVLEKQGFLQKAWGMLMNKLNGSKRYTENVTNVLTNKVNSIENKSIPSLSKKLHEETKQIVETAQKTTDSLSAKTEDWVNKGKEKEEKATGKIVDNSKRTYNGMLSSYRSARMWTISKLEEHLNKLQGQEQNKEEKTSIKNKKENKQDGELAIN